ncbi:MAG: hypothetical protein IPK07_29145 [Deltaproteobacteria bacterium]|nr:hypothetical protein [Deltaproteobacteria bacterium]
MPKPLNPLLRRVLAVALVTSASVVGGGAATAAEVASWDGGSFDLAGSYRFRVGYETEVEAYRTPPTASREVTEELDAGLTGEHRLRLEPKVELFGQATIVSQLDVLDGLLWADTGDRSFLEFSDLPPPNTVGDSFDSFRVNRAWAEWTSPAGVLRVGRQPSHFGLGVVTNDGDGEDLAFGDKHVGDASDRVLFGTKPISLVTALVSGERPDADHDPLTLGVGFDWHVDRGVVVEPGDDTQQVLMALVWDASGSTAVHERVAHRAAGSASGAASRVGFYAAYRDQTHDDRLIQGTARPVEEFLEAWVLDTSGRLIARAASEGDFELRFEWEAAYVTGDTNFTVSRLVSTPSDPFPTSDAEQWGGVGRLIAESESAVFRFELGAASGDGNRYDGHVRDFRFHPDYDVGLVLFSDLLASMTAAQAYNVVHQLGEGGPVPFVGANYLASDGGVTNAVYVNPIVEVDPRPGTALIAGLLWARALESLVDPFNDAFFGGAAGTLNSYGGQAGSKDLGVELDFAVHQAVPLGWDVLRGDVGLEYGHLFTGNAFVDARGRAVPDVDLIRIKLTAEW